MMKSRQNNNNLNIQHVNYLKLSQLPVHPAVILSQLLSPYQNLLSTTTSTTTTTTMLTPTPKSTIKSNLIGLPIPTTSQLLDLQLLSEARSGVKLDKFIDPYFANFYTDLGYGSGAQEWINRFAKFNHFINFMPL